MSRARIFLTVLAAALALPATGHAGDWRLAQPAAPAPPAGQPAPPYVVPLGGVNELSFWSPDRGLMVVAGNDVAKRGLYRWDGRDWAPLSTVCGTTAGGSAPIAWAGPDEFWVVADARADAAPGLNVTGSSTLCHFKDGAFVGSYATSPRVADAYRPMHGAACLAPDDCWFVGDAADGRPFRLHWNGRSLAGAAGPLGNDVLDLTVAGGGFLEARTYVAEVAGDPTTAPGALLGTIAAGATDAAAFGADPFTPAPLPEGLGGAGQVRALDHAGDLTWAVGGAALGQPAPDGTALRGLLVAVREGGGAFQELTVDPAALPAGATAWDVAAEPGPDRAWVSVRSDDPTAAGLLVELDRSGAVLRRAVVPDPADPDKAAKAAASALVQQLACPAADDCWAGTSNGWLFHLTGGPAPGTNDDPAFHRLILDRPADGISAPVISDAAPDDDSGADPGPAIEPPPTSPEPVVDDTPAQQGPTARRIKVRTLSRTAIAISFRLTARAKVRAYAYHGKKLVARSPRRTLKRGARVITLRVSARAWPTRIKLDVKAP